MTKFVLVTVVVAVAAACIATAQEGEDVVALARQLVAIESLTGAESPMSDFLAGWLSAHNYTVEQQPVQPGRSNILAYKGTSRQTRLLFNSHLDTVPPYIGPSEDSDTLYGRGSTDAKSSIAAQLLAAEAMYADGTIGDGDVSFLFVVGEEVDHVGMIASNELGLSPQYLVVGEPTESKLAVGHKGMYKFKLQSKGKAAHSGYPQLGESAIIPLMRLLLELDAAQALFPVDPLLGPTTLNIGTISGGAAANVVPDYAQAEITTRVATNVAEVRGVILQIVQKYANVEVTDELMNEPVVCDTVPGFETAVMAYGTDIPYFVGGGDALKVYLIGPGSITVAHSNDEAISKAELQAHVQLYRDLVEAIFNETLHSKHN